MIVEFLAIQHEKGKEIGGFSIPVQAVINMKVAIDLREVEFVTQCITEDYESLQTQCLIYLKSGFYHRVAADMDHVLELWAKSTRSITYTVGEDGNLHEVDEPGIMSLVPVNWEEKPVHRTEINSDDDD